MNIIQVMNNIAEEIVQEIAVKSRSSKIKEGTSIVRAKETQENVYEVTVLTQAPQAIAFEFGSGLHRTVGTPSKYPIVPKNKDLLKFEWVEAGLGWVSFRSVNHPGVRQRQFFFNSVDETIRASENYQALVQAMRENIILAIREERGF